MTIPFIYCAVWGWRGESAHVHVTHDNLCSPFISARIDKCARLWRNGRLDFVTVIYIFVRATLEYFSAISTFSIPGQGFAEAGNGLVVKKVWLDNSICAAYFYFNFYASTVRLLQSTRYRHSIAQDSGLSRYQGLVLSEDSPGWKLQIE